MLHRILVAVKGCVLLANVLTPERLEDYARAFWELSVLRQLRLIAHCCRCADDRRSDTYILLESNHLEFLRAQPVFVNHHYVVFGDSAYPNTNVMVAMFRGRNLPEWAQEFNKTMTSVRASVEWDTCKYASICLKIELMPVEAIRHVGVFLTNCLTCYWGENQISLYFGCVPPSLEVYLEGVQVTD
ncbi:hypothetical protein PHMEG_0009735 [Phytophthora megakarya]|uniref:DDE Tnp4 domain-containing protein n=1 Tax=Phytophthora megakarya TaxID=4795 RepID=A0A225WFR7_9STRA|nr:hypothetical protein PHMEG_0009735 [Phytophthora megakarya]